MPTEAATFAAGCFWGVEYKFSKLPGVLKSRVGYIGGAKQNPTYKEVCTDETGHAEAVQLQFDPKKITYQKLLEFFFSLHDPTQVDRQGPDEGSQYRSAVFYHSSSQKHEAETFIEKLNQSRTFPKPIATRLEEAGHFWDAEEYHQKYVEKQGGSTCAF